MAIVVVDLWMVTALRVVGILLAACGLALLVSASWRLYRPRRRRPPPPPPPPRNWFDRHYGDD